MESEREQVHEVEREREPEWSDEVLPLGAVTRRENARRRREGKVVVRKSDRPREQRVHGLMRYYTAYELPDTVPTRWRCFTSEIRVHTGRHTHQGGLVLFIVRGRGYTVVDGVRQDWEAGDLLLLPVKPGGVEHEHFNLDDDEPAIWCAFIYEPFFDALNPEVKQSGASPDFRGRVEIIPDEHEHGF